MNRELVADTLERAADLIDEKGWTQGGSGRGPNGESCIGVAINDVLGRTGNSLASDTRHFFEECRDAVLAQLEDAPYCGCGCDEASLPCWNDQPGRTKEDVTTALRKTAITVREKVEL